LIKADAYAQNRINDPTRIWG